MPEFDDSYDDQMIKTVTAVQICQHKRPQMPSRYSVRTCVLPNECGIQM